MALSVQKLFDRKEDGKGQGSELRHALRTWQIFFIALTAVIGTGAFNNFARASATVGPAGSLIAIIVVAIIAACFMEALSELLQVLRTVNPLVEYVHVFVDPALAKCVAGVYWFAYASFMAVQLVVAASYVGAAANVAALVLGFFFIVPIGLGFINAVPVELFAWLETIFGALKLILILSISMILIYVSGTEHGAGYITRGIVPGKGICLVLENIAFTFCGIESIAVMSYEAKGVSALKNSSQIIAWVPLVFYLTLAIAINMCFDWSTQTAIPPFGSNRSAESAVLAAADLLGDSGQTLKKALKVILVFCAVSCANTTLYISSRILYGSAINETRRVWLSIFTIANNWGSPYVAIIFSALAFCVWLPFVSIPFISNANPVGMLAINTQSVIDFFGFAASVGVQFVWGTTCLAYLRYYWWLRKFKKDTLRNSPDLKRYNRWNRSSAPYFTPTAYFRLQPWTTIIGLVGCIVFVFVLPSARWWGRTPTAAEFFWYYLLHLIVASSWLAQKLYEFCKPRNEQPFRWFVKLDSNPDVLWDALQEFRRIDTEETPRLERELSDLSAERTNPPTRTPSNRRMSLPIGSSYRDSTQAVDIQYRTAYEQGGAFVRRR